MVTTQPLLASMARLVSEESPLDVTLSRAAVLLREAIAFERLHVLRLDRSDSVTLYIVRASGDLEVTGHLIGDTPPSPDAVDGMGLHVIKGHEILHHIASSNADADYTHTAIAVHTREQAEALQHVLAA